ncbi:MAG: ABC transporter substrate-binding protein [Opitutales bacterium]|jgi:NitT/TauT family transport system substrate-binding protein
MRKIVERILCGAGWALTLCGLSGCQPAGEETGLDKVVLQTDWFAQPEHGGFYQAQANGYYREAGIEVEILPGGPNSMATQKIIKGRAHFAMNRADTICNMVARGVDVRMVMATLQHDSQGILLHDSSPVRQFEDLDRRRVMAIPGLAWIRWLEAKYDIHMEIIPHDFSLQRFFNDESFIQQCLVTNEPFYARQAGANPRVLRLRDSGFDPYHGIYCRESFARENPDLVRRFIAASIRGWKDYIMGDPSPALDRIAGLNPKMNPEFMAYCYAALKSEQLVTGVDQEGNDIGRLDPERMMGLERELVRLGLLETEDGLVSPWYSTEYLPMPGDEPVNALP